MKRKFWTSDKLVGLSAIFISLLTLIIFVKQTNIIEDQSRLSVMPYLMIEASNNGETQEFILNLENYGVGPAIIEKRVIYYKGKEYNMEFETFLANHAQGMDSVQRVNYSSIQLGLAIPAGGNRNIMTIGGGKKSYTDFLVAFEQLKEDGLDFEIHYRSIYGDMWKITSNNEIPAPID